jgi:hypothetical protein
VASRNPATSGRTGEAVSETVKIPSRGKPLPPDSADRAAQAGPGLAVGRPEGSAEAQAEVLESSCSVVEAGVGRRVDRKELTRYGARSD